MRRRPMEHHYRDNARNFLIEARARGSSAIRPRQGSRKDSGNKGKFRSPVELSRSQRQGRSFLRQAPVLLRSQNSVLVEAGRTGKEGAVDACRSFP